MKVRIDLSKCMGYATCVAEAPKVLEFDYATGQSRVRIEVLPAELIDAAIVAARACPTHAIEIDE